MVWVELEEQEIQIMLVQLGHPIEEMVQKVEELQVVQMKMEPKEGLVLLS
jgi:hypothetical protein